MHVFLLLLATVIASESSEYLTRNHRIPDPKEGLQRAADLVKSIPDVIPAPSTAEPPRSYVSVSPSILHLAGDFEHTTDAYDEGISQVTDSVLLVGERNRGDNLTSFCGALAGAQMRGVAVNRRDAMIFRPAVPIAGPIRNITVAVPMAWFREPKPNRPPVREFKMFYCYEGDTRLVLVPVVARQQDLIERGDMFLFKHAHNFEEFMTIREVALILDGKWNNAFLLPKGSQATLIVDTMEVRRRMTYTRICDLEKGTEQPCCRWPFTSTIAIGVDRKPVQITFHRCLGEIPHESTGLSTLANSEQLLQQGGMSRRFITPPTRVCRESQFRTLKFTARVHGGMHSKKIHRLDALECAVYA